MEVFLTYDGLVALATLAALEIVLGVDNLVFIAIVSARLPVAQQPLARKLGLAMALITRVLLLLTLSWIMGLTQPLFSVFGVEVSGRSIILFAGGLFLIAKATYEIYDKVELSHEESRAQAAARSFGGVVVQIMILDIVFSLDSVITAVGMVDEIAIMIVAIVLAMIVMLLAMERVSGFVEAHPSVKLLALAFLILIGVILVADAFGHHVPKGYIYFSMAFSLGVELLNLRYRSRQTKRPRAA
jgi:predicted tellurium resistance membrane protein TerC